MAKQEEKPFPLGSNKLLYQHKLNARPHTLHWNPQPAVILISLEIYGVLRYLHLAPCGSSLRANMKAINHWGAGNPQDLSPVLSPIQHISIFSPSLLPQNCILVLAQAIVRTAFPLPIIPQELPLFQMAHKQKTFSVRSDTVRLQKRNSQ